MGHARPQLILFTALLAAGLACTLPGTGSPTPFTFPTPDLTLTALAAPSDGVTELTPTLTPMETAAPTATSVLETSATVEATAEDTTSIRPNGTLVRAAQLDQPLTMDGDLSDWMEERSSVTEVVFGRDEWSGGSDLSASYRIAWDAQTLYVAVEVTDDKLVQEATGRSLFKGDSVELLLDTELEADFSSAQLSDDDYQVGFSPGDFNDGDPEAYRWFPRNVEGSLGSPQIASQTLAAGYALEFSLPWASVGLDPGAGDCLGFALSISDNDRAGSVEQQSMVSTVATRDLTDPTTWGTILLADEQTTSCRSPSAGS
jgi:hypothetical protein